MGSPERARATRTLSAPGSRHEEHVLRAPATAEALTAGIWHEEHVRGTGDREIARIAGAQRGLACHAQLVAAELTRSAIAHRRAVGWLTEVYRGVYLVGRDRLEPLGAEMAAVLSFAGSAVLGAGTAAALWKIADALPESVTVIAPGSSRHSRPGLRIHRVAELDRRDIRVHRGLPVTAPARTLLDLAGSVSTAELERALAEARVQRLVSRRELADALARAPRRRGAARLRGLLDAEGEPAMTRREAERRLLHLLKQAGLPRPVVNGRVLGFEVDFHWPAERLIVETDGHQFHGHRGAFERDRRRDQILVAAGYRVMRITWRQLVSEPLAVVARIAMALIPAAA